MSLVDDILNGGAAAPAGGIGGIGAPIAPAGGIGGGSIVDSILSDPEAEMNARRQMDLIEYLDEPTDPTLLEHGFEALRSPVAAMAGAFDRITNPDSDVTISELIGRFVPGDWEWEGGVMASERIGRLWDKHGTLTTAAGYTHELGPIEKMIMEMLVDPISYVPGAAIAKPVRLLARGAGAAARATPGLKQAIKALEHGPDVVASAQGRRASTIYESALGELSETLQKKVREVVKREAKKRGISEAEALEEIGPAITRALERTKAKPGANEPRWYKGFVETGDLGDDAVDEIADRIISGNATKYDMAAHGASAEKIEEAILRKRSLADDQTIHAESVIRQKPGRGAGRPGPGAKNILDERRLAHEEAAKLKPLTERIKGMTGLRAAPKSNDPRGIAEAVAEQVSEDYGRELLDVMRNTKRAAGLSIDYRQGYAMHMHTEPLQAFVKQFAMLPEIAGDAARKEEIVQAITGKSVAEIERLAQARGIVPDPDKSFVDWLIRYGNAIEDGSAGAGARGKWISGELRGASKDPAEFGRFLSGTADDINSFFKEIGFEKSALETDGIHLIAETGRSAGRALGTRRMVAELLHGIGYQGARQGMSDLKVSDVLKRMGFEGDALAGLDDAWIPEEWVGKLRASAREFMDPGKPGKILTVLRGINQWMQKNVIAWFPSYYKMNMATGVQQNLVWERMGPATQMVRLKQAISLLETRMTTPGMIAGGIAGAGAGYSSDNEGIGALGGGALGAFLGHRVKLRAPATIKLKGKVWKTDDIIRLIQEHDVVLPLQGTFAGGREGVTEAIGFSERVSAAGGRLRRGAKAAGKPGQALIEGGASADNANRVALFLELLARGKDPAAAGRRVNELHFPLDVLSTAERGTSTRLGIRDVVPFYAWTRHSIPFTVKMAIQHPKAHYMVGARLASLSGGGHDPEKAGWLREGLRLPTDDEGNEGFRHFRTLPEEALALGSQAGLGDVLSGRMPNPERLLSRLTPAIKYPLERITNRDFFYQQPISEVTSFQPTGGLFENLPGMDYQPPDPRYGGQKGKVDPQAWHFYRNIMPLGRAMSMAQRHDKDPEKNLLAELLPIPIAGQSYDYDEDLWSGLRKKELMRIWMDKVVPDARRYGWVTKYGTFTKQGKAQAPDLHRVYQKIQAMGDSGSSRGKAFSSRRRSRPRRQRRTSTSER